MKNASAVEFPGFIGSGSVPPERRAVILAGGEGARLKSLTRIITGDDRPKQFCSILGDQTLLDVTRKRVGLSIKRENIHYSLTESHRKFFGPLLSACPDRNLIVQPENKGTAPAILYSLMRLARMDPETDVAFFPSDHYFSDDALLMESVDSAFAAVKLDPASVVLLGIEPDKPETSYGWIEPEESLFGNLSRSVSKVRRFWEKPSGAAAQRLFQTGCLWNSFVMVGRVRTFLDLIREHQTALFRMFDAVRPVIGSRSETAAMRSLYGWIPDTNFSTGVLEKSAEDLYVLRVKGVAWSDLGEPQRVMKTLTKIGVRTDWENAVAA